MQAEGLRRMPGIDHAFDGQRRSDPEAKSSGPAPPAALGNLKDAFKAGSTSPDHSLGNLEGPAGSLADLVPIRLGGVFVLEGLNCPSNSSREALSGLMNRRPSSPL